MTQHVTVSEQGRLQGANQSTGGIAAILGPVIFPLSYAWALLHAPDEPGVPVFIAALLLALAFVLALRFARRDAPSAGAPQPA
jgi:MFS family permease